MKTLHRTICAVLGGALLGTIAVATGQTLTDQQLRERATSLLVTSLKDVTPPEPPELYQYVSNKAAAIRLGKALFWDMQVGSDSVTACATCHFHAGADNRWKNQVNPGTNRVDTAGTPAADKMFTVGLGPDLPFMQSGPNLHLKAEFFPLRKLLDPLDRASAAIRDTNDVVSSQGVFNTKFVDTLIKPGVAIEEQIIVPDTDGFRIGNLNVRKVEPRHTPSVINAVFNHRNFWDGRAQAEFNGVNHRGKRDPSATVAKLVGNQLQQVSVLLTNASLASQAVAPITSAFEMSGDGRSGADIGNKFAKKLGKKAKTLRPLGLQKVHREDSVLGSLSRWPDQGLTVDNYETMIKAAFRPEWWSSTQTIAVTDSGGTDYYTQLQYNFSLFFGIAIQLYEATLVSDDTPFDRFMKGDNSAMSAQAKDGMRIFLESDNNVPRGVGARCVNCHAGAEMTDGSVTSIRANTLVRVRNGQVLDRGYNNVGVRPTLDDRGVGGADPLGPLSAAAQCRLVPVTDPLPPLCPSRDAQGGTAPLAVDGAFKAPGLRNVELTAPYFHNGGYLTLESVIQFYSRGGDLAPLKALNGTTISPLDPPFLNADEQKAVVAFLKALTDERVRYRRAPFDNPQLFVPDGQQNDQLSVREHPYFPGIALDRFREIPPVGRNGGTALPLFLQNP